MARFLSQRPYLSGPVGTGVSPGNYGSSDTIPTYTVDEQGRIVTASNVPVAISVGQVSGLAAVATSGSYNDLSDLPTLGDAALQDSSAFADADHTHTADDISGLAPVARSGAAADVSGLATVAISGSYNDLTDLPTLGSAALEDSSAFADAEHTHAASEISGLAAVATSGDAADVSGLAAVATSGSYDDLIGSPRIVENYIAQGALATGDAVGLRFDGKVDVVRAEENTTSKFPFETGRTEAISTIYISGHNKVVIAYRDDSNSNFGTAVVGDIVGSSINFGTPVVFEAGSTYDISAYYLSSIDRVVIVYRYDNLGTAVVGTIASSSVSFGAPVVFPLTQTEWTESDYDIGNEKIIIGFMPDDSSSSHAVVGIISGSSISFGARVAGDGSQNANVKVSYNSVDNKFALTGERLSEPRSGRTLIGTINGSSISFGSDAIFAYVSWWHTVYYSSKLNKVIIAYSDYDDRFILVGDVDGSSVNFGSDVAFAGNGQEFDIFFHYDDAAEKLLVTYQDENNGDQGIVAVGAIQGANNIAFGTPVVFNSDRTYDISPTFNEMTGKLVISFRDQGDNKKGKAVIGTVVGDSMSFEEPIVFETGLAYDISSTYDSGGGRIIVAYRDAIFSHQGAAVILEKVPATGWIGIAQTDAVAGQTVEVLLMGGIDENQTGLVPGQRYYINESGDIQPTQLDGYKPFGVALSETRLKMASF